MVNVSADGTVALHNDRQTALSAPPAGGQINLLQATNVAQNLTAAEFPIASSSAENPSPPTLVVASASNMSAHARDESAVMPWDLTEKTLLQLTAAPSDDLLRQRSASSPPLSVVGHVLSQGTVSASTPTYLDDSSHLYDTKSAMPKTVKKPVSPLEKLRETIAEDLTETEKRAERQKKLNALGQILAKRQPGMQLELADLDLSGLDLSTLGMPLENIHFLNCQLNNVHFPAALHRCQFTECEANNISLNRVVLTKCDIISSRFNQLKLLSAQLIRCTLSYVQMCATEAEESLFSHSALSACNLSGATLTQCRFPDTTLANNIWTNTTTRDNVFNGATLMGSFHGANFSDDSMRKVAIADADFSGVILADNCTLAPLTAAEQLRYFDPVNSLCVRLLHAIHSSEEGELAIKTRLVRQLIKPLDLTDMVAPANVAKTLLTLLSRPPYRDDRRIYPFVMALLPSIEPVSAISFLSAQEQVTWRNALAILRAPAELERRVYEEHNRHGKMQVFEQIVNRSRSNRPLTIHGVNIREITFNGWHFKNVDLSFGDFRSSQFHNCTFDRCKLRTALLQKCYFINCIFTGETDITAADLTDAVLINCKLNRLEASRIIFTRARIEDVEIKDANLTGAEMSGSYLINCELAGSDLSAATLHNARLVTTFMDNTLLAECSLANSTLYNVTFTGADLSATGLEQIDVINACFRDCQLNASLTIQFPQWDDTTLKLYLDHFSHPEGSLLQTLATIPDDYAGLRMQLAEELIDSLQASGMDLTLYIKPLIDTFGRQLWRQNPRIEAFNHQLIEQHFTAYDLHALPPLGVRAISAILENLQDNLSLAYHHQSAFLQLINQAIFIEQHPTLRQLALRIYDNYLQQPAVRSALEQRNSVSMFNNVIASEMDWQDAQATNFLLISAQPDGPLMLLSGANLQRMLDTIPISWDGYWLIRNGRVLEHAQYTTEQLLSLHFPMFYPAWQEQQRLSPLSKLISALHLDDDLYTLFINAASQSVSTRKLTDLASLQALEQTFQPLLAWKDDGSRECSLTEQHCQEIFSLYGLHDASERAKAETLFCIAIVFTRYAAATHFGDDVNSPPPVRSYAYACMAEARRRAGDEIFIVAPPPTDVAPNIDYFPEWQGRLLGTAQPARRNDQEGEEADEEVVNYLHCADTLATHMLGLAQMVCPETVNRFYPPTWS